eukprot:snap_masked-scaffold_12-processed-gene-12.21-mRNA-1 protein AED:1.00 eAED:1.00 QI:0/-1/0/0/-1/1/1/0/258
MNKFSAKDKICVVTGAAGIGFEYCRALATAGAKHICLVDIHSQARLISEKSLSKEFPNLIISTYEADVSKREEVKKVINSIVQTHGTIDLFAANAGYYSKGTGLDCWIEKEFDITFSVNTKQVLYAFTELLPVFRNQGRGCFVVTASAGGLFPVISDVNYFISKSATISICKYLNERYTTEGIQTVCVCPAAVKTGMLKDETGKEKKLESPIKPIEAYQVAEAMMKGLKSGKCLVLAPEKELIQGLRVKQKEYEPWNI